MQGLEILTIDEFIYHQLITDTGVGGLFYPAAPLVGMKDPSVPEVYSDTLPSDVKYPYVLFTMQSNADTMTTDGTRVLSQGTYLVKGVHRAENYGDPLRAIASRIDVRLHKASGPTADGYVYHCRRLQTVRYPEVTEAVSYRHLGGSYRFWTEAT